MKNYFLLLLSLCYACVGFAQADTKTELTNIVEGYFKIVEQKDYSKILDATYPKLFEMVSRADMERALKSIDGDPNMKINMRDFELHRLSDTIMIDAATFALVDYGFTMDMQIISAEDDKKGEVFGMITGMLTSQYGAENVEIDEKAQTLAITVQNTLFAINDPQYDGWKFMERKAEQRQLIGDILPAEAWSRLE